MENTIIHILLGIAIIVSCLATMLLSSSVNKIIRAIAEIRAEKNV